MFYFNSSGIFSKLDTSVTLSVRRDRLAGTTISYNGISYAIFGGGSSDTSNIDAFYINSNETDAISDNYSIDVIK